MSAWYYAKNNQQYGPVSPEELKKLAVTGQLKPTDLVCKPGMTEWKTADCVKGLFPDVPAIPSRSQPKRPSGFRPIHKIIATAVGIIGLIVVGLLWYYREGSVYAAVRTGDMVVLQKVLDAGEDPNRRERSLMASQMPTPLFLAVVKGRIDMVELLLKHGADPCVRSSLGETPLHRAVWSETSNPAIVMLLLCAGADANVLSREGVAALACVNDANPAADTIRYCLQDFMGDVNKRYGNERFTALERWAGVGNAMLVNRLIQMGANVRAKDAGNMTALHCAAFSGHLDVMRILLSAGADVNAQTISGVTPLWLTAYAGNRDCAEVLLKSGGNIRIPRCDGVYPWHLAAFRGFPQVAEWLASGVPAEERAGNFSQEQIDAYQGNLRLADLALR